MSKFKAGDTVRDAVGDTFEVVAYHEETQRLWLISPYQSSPLTYPANGFTKVVPFFEVGKKYTQEGGSMTWQPYFQKRGLLVFEPQFISTERESEERAERKVAVGKVTMPVYDVSRWVVLNQRDFGYYTEMRDE